jgi:DNA-binding CsgD family transcriptional regulator
MQLVTISRAPIPAEQLERGGCRLIGKASAADTFFAVLTCRGADLGLTPRQMEVLRLTIGGLTVAEVAHKLDVSRKTVERHLRHCRQRLSAVNDVQLGAVAERWGL